MEEVSGITNLLRSGATNIFRSNVEKYPYREPD